MDGETGKKLWWAWVYPTGCRVVPLSPSAAEKLKRLAEKFAEIACKDQPKEECERRMLFAAYKVLEEVGVGLEANVETKTVNAGAFSIILVDETHSLLLVCHDEAEIISSAALIEVY